MHCISKISLVHWDAKKTVFKGKFPFVNIWFITLSIFFYSIKCKKVGFSCFRHGWVKKCWKTDKALRSSHEYFKGLLFSNYNLRHKKCKYYQFKNAKLTAYPSWKNASQTLFQILTFSLSSCHFCSPNFCTSIHFEVVFTPSALAARILYLERS
jgi:hypothetical protein